MQLAARIATPDQEHHSTSTAEHSEALLKDWLHHRRLHHRMQLGTYKSPSNLKQHSWRVWLLAGGFLVLTALHFTLKQQGSSSSSSSLQDAGMLPTNPLRIAIYNQVHIHLHVVAGVMQVLRPFTSGPITVFLLSEVLNGNRYGFMEWLGQLDGFQYKDCKQFEQTAPGTYDLVWYISPEWDSTMIQRIGEQASPKLALYYVHNGHMPEPDFDVIKRLSPDVPLLTMAPHVAQYVSRRLQDNKTAGAATTAEWVLPTFPYQPLEPCTLQQMQAGPSCLAGFSIAGSTDPKLRNYTRMWEQIRSYRDKQGRESLKNFKLNILGEIMDNFTVPDDLQQYVALYKTPSDPVFYEVNCHGYGIIPALANPAYYKSKLTSAAITSLMTGVPVIADSVFLSAYSMLDLSTVYHQAAGQSELDVMFRVAAMPAGELWRTRTAVQQLRYRMNARGVNLILGWLLDKGLVPDADSNVANIL